MAEEQKNVEVAQETKPETTPAPATETPAVESKPPEETPAESAPATEDKPVEESKPAETEESKAEDKKEEVKPVEEGHLGHKAQGLSFPKNLIASKEFFFFGTDAFEPKALAHYLKTEKSAETAHSNIAWASHTGQGLLFIGDKKNPSSIISLADATEPETDGSHKFHFTSKGNKHSFNAANTAERDNWVTQLKLKIAEAKELAATVTESEAYKKTIESFKPAPPKKEKAAETPKEEAKAEESAPAPATEETPKEEKTEGSKRRSVSLPFAFGKREKSPPPAEGEEKSGKSPFSKLHATIKGKAKAKEKPAEETKPEEPVKEEAKEEDKTEPPKEEEPAKQAEPEAENKPDNVASSTLAATTAT
ncbi:Pleckstrin homology domain-containing protein [Ilyonectria robusta]|uniref:Pleckstrin homology domain-containing protein n=1 Tax=Ilyonectria robusta TaxID=1079257 RepID=UPI001E8DEB00|nr:Pleckstrin homology domain-containing protein [Ilyonectria robusta]KAH8661719.1 Pleckstrin homology domain-containing protein [Ilyonectria robusta]